MGHQHGISALVPHADVDFRLSLLASLASFQYQLFTWTHCRNCVPVTLNGTWDCQGNRYDRRTFHFHWRAYMESGKREIDKKWWRFSIPS